MAIIQWVKTIWAFSRPHTIIGSFLSISALYAISIAIVFDEKACAQLIPYGYTWLATLISSLACNIYITGLNQLADIDLDKINKPWLPIPSGRLSVPSARTIVLLSGILAISIALLINWILLCLIVVIMALGTAYSLPPLKLKRHHLAAAASILLVRGVLVNVGMPVHFVYAFSGQWQVPPDVWPLTFFVVGFSLAIAWFKDIPDTQGDARYNIKTLALVISAKSAFRYGVVVVALSYAGLLILASWLQIQVHQAFFFLSHGLLMMLFLVGAARVPFHKPDKLAKFYLAFWGFFFAEYIVYTLAYYI